MVVKWYQNPKTKWQNKYFFASSDEAPDTGDDSDEDLITSYIGSNLGGGQGTADSLIPTIQVTPHSPNANRVLGKQCLHISKY